jgi:transposase, IS30 family
MTKYKQLTKDQRLKLEALHKRGISPRQIAIDLGVHHSTVYREIKRNQSKRGCYNANSAQQYCTIRKERFSYHRKLTPAMESFIIEKLQKEQWSPEQIHGYCKTHGIVMVSHERIYQFIYQDKVKGGLLYKHLRIYSKPYRRRYGSYKRRGRIVDRVSIDQRPAIVQQRSRIGDWEADTIVGSDHQAAILTMVERKSKFLQTAMLPTTQARITSKKLINALAPYKQAVHTITTDNGHEFARHKYISKKLQADYFFTHPYSAWEKGTNENINGLLRQYIPKKTPITQVDEQYLQHATQKLNTRPRKSLNWKTPLEVFMTNFKPSNNVALGT